MEANDYKIFIPNGEDNPIRKISLKKDRQTIFLAAGVVLIIAELIFNAVLSARLDKANESILSLTAQLQEVREENRQFEMENSELKEKVAILSETINNKVDEAQKEAKNREPLGFPLKGTASYSEAELDGHPIAYFEVSAGVAVIATANGTVSSVTGSAKDGYIVTVDHGNDYYSVYINGSAPKVGEGDEVTKATELFVIDAEHKKLGYQIIEKNNYINPLELMEVYG